MQPIRSLLAAFLLAACALPAAAQTIKTLGYNTTNGQVVYSGTNTLTFTNTLVFGDDVSGSAFESSSGTNSVRFDSAGVTFGGSAAASTRTNVGLPAVWLTNTNVTNFRTAIGLGASDNVVFNDATVFSLIVQDVTPINIAGDGLSFNDTNSTNIANGKAGWRDSLGLPLPALTNNSNVTMMRALAGTTNTSEPFSGTFVFVDDSANAWSATVSNGIILSVIEQ